MNLKLIHKEKISKDSWELIFEKPEGFIYEPGQFLEIILNHENSDDRGVKRWFTMSSSPTEGDLMIATRYVDKHSSFKEALLNLETGDTIEAKGPMGSFIMPTDMGRKLIWIAGGIGITPFRSQMKFILDNQEQRDITLIYSNRTIEDVCFNEIWKEAETQLENFHFTQTLVDEVPSNWTGERGVIDEAMLKRVLNNYDLKKCEFFVSGPEPMVEAFKPMLNSFGINDDSIHQDWFPNYTEKF